MEIIVCVKETPDLTEPLQYNADAQGIDWTGVRHELNPWDLHAVEEGLRLCERHGGRVTTITMGPPRASEILRYCLSLGADAAVHLYDETFADVDAQATAAVLAAGIRRLSYDLVLCGCQANSGNTGLVGPFLADHLGLPFISPVVQIQVSEDQESVTVTRRVEHGDRQVLRCSLPAVLAVDLNINEPRYPPLKRRLQARKAGIEMWDREALHLDQREAGETASRVHLMEIGPPRPWPPKKVFTPPSDLPAAERLRLIISGGIIAKKGTLLEAPPDAAAKAAVEFLLEKRIIQVQQRPTS